MAKRRRRRRTIRGPGSNQQPVGSLATTFEGSLSSLPCNAMAMRSILAISDECNLIIQVGAGGCDGAQSAIEEDN